MTQIMMKDLLLILFRLNRNKLVELINNKDLMIINRDISLHIMLLGNFIIYYRK